MANQVQLAYTHDGRSFNGYERYSRKFDGKRMYVTSLPDVIPFSRTNKLCNTNPIRHILDEIEALTIHLEALKKHSFLNDIPDFVFDGEVLYFEDIETGIENFKKAISLTSRKYQRSADCDKLYYVLFDIIDQECFEEKIPYMPFDGVYELMCKLLGAREFSGREDLLKTDYPHIFIAKQHHSVRLLEKQEGFENWEGLMCRDGSATYDYKRSLHLLKLKDFYDCECPIVGFKEGVGKYEGTLGAIIVDYKGHEVSVGTGFIDQERDIIWNNREKYKNLLLRVKYFEESCDAKGKVSLRFPSFLGFRDYDLNDIAIK